MMVDAPGPGYLLPALFQAVAGHSVRNAPEGLRSRLSGKRIPAQQRLLSQVVAAGRFVGYVIPGPAIEEVILPFMSHMVSRRACTVKRLIKEIQELLLVSHGQSERLLK